MKTDGVVYLIERSKDGGATWKALYNCLSYVHEERAAKRVNQMNIDAAKYASKFRDWRYRAVKYARA